MTRHRESHVPAVNTGVHVDRQRTANAGEFRGLYHDGLGRRADRGVLELDIPQGTPSAQKQSFVFEHGVAASDDGHAILDGEPAHQGTRAVPARPLLGEAALQPKLHITPWERTNWGISGGSVLRPIDTPKARVGVLICYDVEFPEAARYLADLGAEILFVPFCTDTRQSYLRVRYCAQARAVENQVYVALTGNVGNLPDVGNSTSTMVRLQSSHRATSLLRETVLRRRRIRMRRPY